MIESKCMLTYNGDIYSDGMGRLKQLAAIRGDGSDTSILLKAFSILGQHTFQEIGATNEFALGIYTQDNNTFFITRDFTGNRPLFYLHDIGKGTFIFSSVALSLIQCIKNGLCAGEICELTPGNIIQGTPEHLFVEPLAKQNLAIETDSSFNEFVGTFYKIIEDSIRLRVPPTKFGIKMSGGLDSITALHIARKILTEQDRDPREVTPITFGKPESPDVQSSLLYYREHAITNFTLVSAEENMLFKSIPEVIRIVESNHLNHIRIGTINRAIALRAHELELPILLSGEGVEEIFGSYPDVFLAGYHPLVEKFYPQVRGMSPEQAFTEMWKLFYLQRAITERWRTDRIMTGSGINDRPYITDRRIEDTAEKLFAEGKINEYFRHVEPGKHIIDKYVFRLAMNRFGRLNKQFAFRPKLHTIAGSGMGTHDPVAGLFSKRVKALGFSSLQEYINSIFTELGLNIPALLHPERKMTKILGTVAQDFIVNQ